MTLYEKLLAEKHMERALALRYYEPVRREFRVRNKMW